MIVVILPLESPVLYFALIIIKITIVQLNCLGFQSAALGGYTVRIRNDLRTKIGCRLIVLNKNYNVLRNNLG